MDDFIKLNSCIGQLNKETSEHSKRVGELMQQAAETLGLDSALAYRMGCLHDIGKIHIPPRILKKNGRLNPVERTVVDMHSYYGYLILKDAGEPEELYIPVLYHHGTKSVFPEHPEIQPEMEIYIELLHCLDVYDALTHKRSYHQSMSPVAALEILKKEQTVKTMTLFSITPILKSPKQEEHNVTEFK